MRDKERDKSYANLIIFYRCCEQLQRNFGRYPGEYGFQACNQKKS